MTHPLLIAALLASVVAGLKSLENSPKTNFLFRLLPVAFWCYFLPMILAGAGIVPHQSPLYTFLAKTLLPFCLALLLVSVNIQNVRHLSRPAAIALAVSFGSVAVAGPAVYFFLAGRLPEGAWRTVGMLSASWTGGSANMLAVKEALATPESLFAPTIVVDALLAYSWMAMLILVSAHQKKVDAWLKAAPVTLNVWNAAPADVGWTFRLRGVAICLALAAIAFVVSYKTPLGHLFFTPTTWAILIVTTLALGFSLTGICRKEEKFLETAGRYLLYFLLTSLGAQASIASVLNAPLLFVLGAVWLMIHGICLVAAGRIFRIPLSLLATASQAGVGGPVSAPLVAEVYTPGLAAAGVLMAVFGNAVGTYIGLFCARAAEFLAR